MRKIKVLRIIARLNIGGPAIHTVLLTQGLDKSKFESLLACGNIDEHEGDMLYYALDKNIKPIFIPELKRKLSFRDDLVAFIKIYNIIRKERPDIIHTHTAKAGALGRLAGILYNCLSAFTRPCIKLVHTFHGHIFGGYFSKFKTRIFIFIEKFLSIFTSKIITVSNSVAEELLNLRICKKDKMVVIPLGLELEEFFQIPIRDNVISCIGIIGRLVPIKNHRLFLEAAAKVIVDNPQMQLRFKIIGDGELRKVLEEYAHKLNIQGQVDFLGWQKDLVDVYANLDVVTLTSINEGMPVSLIEAMASGRMIIATDVGGVRDLLGKEVDINIKPNADFRVLEKGIIVKPGDSFGFASALNFIFKNNALRKNITERARNFIKEGFTKERLIRDIENLYHGILNHYSI
jgi:glycosyltransferase involved in cell wall biosynthesis